MKAIPTKILTFLLVMGFACLPGQLPAMQDTKLKVAATAALGAFICINAFASQIVHEFGHAIPTRIFTKEPVQVIINAPDPDYRLRKDKDGIKIFPSIYPAGYSFVTSLSLGCNLSQLQHVTIDLGGPCAELAWNYGIFKLMASSLQNSKDPYYQKLWFAASFMQVYSLFLGWRNLLPLKTSYGASSDGDQALIALHDKPWWRKAYYASVGALGIGICALARSF